MRTSLQTTTLAVFALLFIGALSQQLISDRDHYCSGVTLDPYALSAGEMADERDRTWTDFYSDYDTLFDFARDPNSNTFVKMYRWQFGLYLTLVLLMLISFLFFLIYCCWRKQYTRNWHRECMILFVIFFIVFLALFITIIVFIGISQNKAKRAYCVIHSMPATLLYGNPKAVHRQEFIGYQPLINLLGNYSNEIGNLNATYAQANSIVAAQLPNTTTTLANNWITWWNFQASTKVRNADREIFADSYIRNSRAGPEIVQAEFGALDTLARDLYTTASEIRFLNSNWYAEDSKANLATMRNQLQSIYSRYDTIMNEFTRKAMRIQSYSIGGFWTFFGLGIAILVLSLIIIIVYFACRSRAGYNACRWLYILLIILSLLAIIYGICVLILMAGVAGMSSFCRFTAELNQGGWTAANTFERYMTTANSTLNNTDASALLKGCFFQNSTGYIPGMLNSTSYVNNSYDRLISLVNGLTTYQRYINIWGPFTNTTSPALTNLSAALSARGKGDYYENTNIYLKNAELNRIVSCSGRQVGWTANTCSNYYWASCDAFPANSYSAPSCASNASAVGTYYFNIQNHVTSEAAYTANLINGLGTFNSQYANALAAFQAQKSNIETIRNALPNTLAVVSNYNNTLKEITNCNNLQVEMMQFERYACFPFVKPLYVLLVLALVSTFFLFLMMWALWAAAACLKSEEVGTVVTTTKYPVAQGEFLAVSEQELVPKY